MHFKQTLSSIQITSIKPSKNYQVINETRLRVRCISYVEVFRSNKSFKIILSPLNGSDLPYRVFVSSYLLTRRRVQTYAYGTSKTLVHSLIGQSLFSLRPYLFRKCAILWALVIPAISFLRAASCTATLSFTSFVETRCL